MVDENCVSTTSDGAGTFQAICPFCTLKASFRFIRGKKVHAEYRSRCSHVHALTTIDAGDDTMSVVFRREK